MSSFLRFAVALVIGFSSMFVLIVVEGENIVVALLFLFVFVFVLLWRSIYYVKLEGG